MKKKGISKEELNKVERFVGESFKLTKAQLKKLYNELTEDILFRYNNYEYWDMGIVGSFIQDNKIRKGKEYE